MEDININIILTYLYHNPVARLVATVGLVAIALIIVWLLLRNIRLWYWKTEKVLTSLSNIETRIGEMEHSLDRVKINLENLYSQKSLEEDTNSKIDIAERTSSSKGVDTISKILLEMEQDKRKLENAIDEEEIERRIRD